MIQVSNTNNQLVVTWANGLSDYYAFEDMKSVTPYNGQKGKFIVINFINENRNSSLRLPYAEISNQPSWTTLQLAVAGISAWMDTSIGGGLATENTLLNVRDNTADIVSYTSPQQRVPRLIRATSSGNINSLAPIFFSVSVANVGSANGTVLGTTIKPGEILNFSADALNNYFYDFSYNATGTEFVITFII